MEFRLMILLFASLVLVLTLVLLSWDNNFLGLLANQTYSGSIRDKKSPTLLSKHSAPHSASNWCSRSQLRRGRWVETILEYPPYKPSEDRLSCYPPEAYVTSDENPKNWTYLEWEPYDDCTFSKWNSNLFCSLAQNKTITMVGDSLTWEMYSSLAQLLRLKIDEKDQLRSRKQHRNHVQRACNGTVTLVYRRDDYLGSIDRAVNQSKTDVLILNRGSHFVPDTEFQQGFQRIHQSIANWRADCLTRKKKCHLIYRTTVPGHPRCALFTEPSQSLEEMEALISNQSMYDGERGAHWKYNWHHFQHQNELALDALKSHWNDVEENWNVLDAYYINILRPDRHRSTDCLHSCLPGKMDVYNQILLHYLQASDFFQE